MQRKFILALVAVVLALSFAGGSSAKAQNMPTIGVMQLVTQPALDAARMGAIESLGAAGFVDGKTAKFVFANADGDIPTLATIAQKFVDQNVDVIITISTPAAQAAYNATKDTQGPPVVFSVVTSPYAAGVAQSPCVHPAWMIGTQALAPYADTVPLIFKIVPNAKTIGYIYNPAEANSVASTKILQPLMTQLGLKMEIQTIANSSEVGTAAEALVSKHVDAFYMGTDNTVVTALDALVKVANDNKIPLFASDTATAARGAVLGQGLDYTQDGRDAGKIAALILNKKLDISKAKINQQKNTSLALNLDAADAQGVKIPDDLVSKAALLYKGGKNVATSAVSATPAATMAADSGDPFVAALQCTAEELAATPAK